MTKLRVMLVDDHALLREGLKALIGVQSDMSVVGECADGRSAVNAAPELRPDVVVMDISMPVLNGADATLQLKRCCPSARVLALTAHEDSGYVEMLLRAGASGYLLKRAAPSDLVRAIRSVASGALYLDTTLAEGQPRLEPVVPPNPGKTEHAALSEREAEVLRLTALGYSMKQMAASLELSARTLETYKMRAMNKLDLESRADIVRFALQQGWLKDG